MTILHGHMKAMAILPTAIITCLTLNYFKLSVREFNLLLCVTCCSLCRWSCNENTGPWTIKVLFLRLEYV